MKKVYIYCLKSSDDVIRYVGKTTNLERRLYGHISEAKRKKGKTRYVLNWIKSLIRKGQKPIIEVLEVCEESIWEDRERHWIAYYRKLYDNLCNKSDGGGGYSGSKNYTKNELAKKAEIMSNTMSKFNQNTKLIIWNMIQVGKTIEEIQVKYPDYSRQMDFGVRNGRQWNKITGLPKTKGGPKKKGWVQNRGLYICRDKNRRTLFSSRDLNKVLEYIKLHNIVKV